MIVFCFLDFLKTRIKIGFLRLIELFIAIILTLIAIIFLSLQSMFGVSEDRFADNLHLPENLVLETPDPYRREFAKSENDSYQNLVISSLIQNPQIQTSIDPDISSLEKSFNDYPDILLRYLATSPAWRLFKENGKIFATRRWMISSQWHTTLNGFYDKHSLNIKDTKIPDFQTRLTIGLSSIPLWQGEASRTTTISSGKTTPLNILQTDRTFDSHCLIKGTKLILEILEQTPIKERIITQTTLCFLRNEFLPIAQNPNWDQIIPNLPNNSILRGAAQFKLKDSFQPGIYLSSLWINPGESGVIYLKAFEITKGTALSVDRLKKATEEYVGWSNNPDELFFSSSDFTIYEGDWGKPYAARFEVWFIPNSGTKERKLLEKNFKIEGWQR